MWRRRFQRAEERLKSVKSSRGKEVSNIRHWQTLERKCSVRLKTLGVVEELKQRIVANAGCIKKGWIDLD